MTTQEKLIAILSRNCKINIYPRSYPPTGGEQGFLPSELIHTSEKEGRVEGQASFCIGYTAKREDKMFVDHFFEFPIFIDNLYKKMFKKEEALLVT